MMILTSQEVKDKLLAALLECVHGGTTRYLCNTLYRQETRGYITLPGRYRMAQVYGCLRTLAKQGEVVSVYPGYWKLTKQTEQ